MDIQTQIAQLKNALVKLNEPYDLNQLQALFSDYETLFCVSPSIANQDWSFLNTIYEQYIQWQSLNLKAKQEKNNTLIIKSNGGYPKYALTAEIRSNQLSAFTYDGYGVITGSRLSTRNLNLSINNPGNTLLGGQLNLRRLAVYGTSSVRLNGVSGNNIQVVLIGKPRVQLVGVFNINTLDLNGNGFLSGYWIKSDKLIIKEHGNIHLQLAGSVNILEVALWDHANFNGRYLRANRAFVKTHGESVAKLSAVRRQHTLASDASDIYFYNLPELRTDFMAFDGAVLDMRDWNLLCEQEYTIYNK